MYRDVGSHPSQSLRKGGVRSCISAISTLLRYSQEHQQFKVFLGCMRSSFKLTSTLNSPLVPGNRTATLPTSRGEWLADVFFSMFVYSFIMVCFIILHHIKRAIRNKQTLLDNTIVFISAIKIVGRLNPHDFFSSEWMRKY